MTLPLERTRPVVVARPAAPRRRNRDRLHALDGLRGIAALVVVLHHLFLIAEPVVDASDPDAPALWWWLQRTPLKLLSAGHEAVIVFFVLSGLVVALPALKRVDFSWPGLVASRVVRLFLPAWASLVLAGALLLAVPRLPEQVTGGSWLARQTQSDWSWQRLVQEFSLMVGGVPFNNVLWTLRWEFLFSLLLPGFLVLAVVLHRWWLPTALAMVGLCVAGSIGGIEAMEYLPVFFLGTLLAVRLVKVETWSETRRAKRLLAGVLVVSLLLLVIQWMLAGVVRWGTDGSHALAGLEVAGAGGIVVCAAAATGFRRFLERRVPQFLGRTSFSLYLVHLPVLATLAFLLGDWNWAAVGLIGVPLAVLTGWVFYRVVEKPLHKVARKAKKGAAQSVERYVRAGKAGNPA